MSSTPEQFPEPILRIPSLPDRQRERRPQSFCTRKMLRWLRDRKLPRCFGFMLPVETAKKIRWCFRNGGVLRPIPGRSRARTWPLPVSISMQRTSIASAAGRQLRFDGTNKPERTLGCQKFGVAVVFWPAPVLSRSDSSNSPAIERSDTTGTLREMSMSAAVPSRVFRHVSSQFPVPKKNALVNPSTAGIYEDANF